MAAVENESRPVEALSVTALLAGSEGIREIIYRWCYIVLGATFVVTALVCSIRSSRTEEDAVTPIVRGPGGKPLPVTKRKKNLGFSGQGNGANLPEIGPFAKTVFKLLSGFLALTFFLNGAAVVFHAWKANRDLPAGQVNWWCGEPMVVYILGSSCVYVYFTVTLFEWKTSPGLAHILTWLLALAAEVTIFLCTFFRAKKCKIPRIDDGGNFGGRCLGFWEQIDMALSLTRVAAGGSHERRPSSSGTLANCAETQTGLYRDEQAAFYRPEKLPKRNWFEYLRGYTLFWPYLWPRESFWLRFRVFICFLLLILQRGVNILLPYQIGQVTDRLAQGGGEGNMATMMGGMPWVLLWSVNLLMLMQGQAGLLGSVRSIIWVKVSQYSYKALETAAFEHVHSLSLDFHLGKRTGEVLSALNKGGAINTFLEQVTFQLIPMIVDLFLAIYFFHLVFDGTYGTIVTVNVFWYLYLTVKMAQTRADQRREMTNADREEEAVKNDSITSYETVKYFNAEQYEFRRYERAIDDFQRAEANVSYGTNLMAIVQTVVFISGLTVALTVAGVDLGERLLELFKIQPSVKDLPHVKDLPECNGHIRWRGVQFSYGNQPALNDLDFECAPGTTTAFVGESGGGKSTVFRLMFRYYNCSEGRIEIDGRDVKDLTIDSVRRYIGVVPQDTILFNETLMYNLKYARPGCTDEEVFEACKAASIHDKIMAFPEQYNTKVGERGLRLSGGEKQRVAIARTILKNPKIIMLDEATSALDSRTEQQIQRGVLSVGQGRTVLIIAHRLSTITHADQIIVLNQGRIVERGTHEELIQIGGYYTSMWEKQAQATRAANRECLKLLKQANLSTRKHLDAQSEGYSSMASSSILPEPSPMNESKPVSPIDYDHSSDGESSHTTFHGELDRH
ncbi:unnamed protein product [Parascedosporium putredinis]|uniref:Heavy metal tolerance protein n=1 Tax=Parascedosporium putredinis TaxID=1442378 RepID=A0A9P1HAU6_9PEZI|nr:unnamed protein product [Parascedosporium putredinis]CAI8003080.1 unnamed protein product [Parascedosporium putredinis]